ncbi:hypothetical protein HRG_014056 [Hirsutella rhossiliensis]
MVKCDEDTHASQELSTASAATAGPASRELSRHSKRIGSSMANLGWVGRRKTCWPYHALSSSKCVSMIYRYAGL